MLEKITATLRRFPSILDFRSKIVPLLDFVGVISIVIAVILFVVYAIKHGVDLANIFLILSKNETTLENQIANQVRVALGAMPDSAFLNVLQQNTLHVDPITKSYTFIKVEAPVLPVKPLIPYVPNTVTSAIAAALVCAVAIFFKMR